MRLATKEREGIGLGVRFRVWTGLLAFGSATLLVLVQPLTTEGKLFGPLPELARSEPDQWVLDSGTSLGPGGSRDFTWVTSPVAGASPTLWSRSGSGGYLGPRQAISSDVSGSSSLMRVAAGEMGSGLVWVEDEERDGLSFPRILALQRGSGLPRFTGSPATLCQASCGRGLDFTEGLDGSSAAVYQEGNHLVFSRPNFSGGSWSQEEVAEIPRSSLSNPRLSVGSSGEIAVIWEDNPPGGDQTVLAVHGTTNEGLLEPQTIGTARGGYEPDYDIAVGPESTVIALWDGSQRSTKRIEIYRSQENADEFSRFPIQLSQSVSTSDIHVAADRRGRVVLGLGRNSRCRGKIVPTVRRLGIGESAFGQPSDLFRARGSLACSDNPDRSSFDLLSAPGDGSIVAFWGRSRFPKSEDPQRDFRLIKTEMRVLSEGAAGFGPKVTFGFRRASRSLEAMKFEFSAWDRKSVATLVYGEDWDLDYRTLLFGGGCDAGACLPRRQMGSLKVRRIREREGIFGGWVTKKNGRKYYTYGLFLQNTGTIWLSGVKRRFATMVIGREKGWKRWTSWKRFRSGSLDVGSRGRNDLLLRVPPAGSSYKVKAEIKATGIRKKSVIFRVK